MTQKLTHRKAQIIDLRTIINLLLEDEFGQIQEKLSAEKAKNDSYRTKNFDMPRGNIGVSVTF